MFADYLHCYKMCIGHEKIILAKILCHTCGASEEKEVIELPRLNKFT